METFTYLRQMLDERGGGHVRIFGGGGGVIVPREIAELHATGIDRIFTPEDGRALGLQGMINVVVEGCDFDLASREVAAGRHLAAPGAGDHPGRGAACHRPISRRRPPDGSRGRPDRHRRRRQVAA